jgi:hypothetical protein
MHYSPIDVSCYPTERERERERDVAGEETKGKENGETKTLLFGGGMFYSFDRSSF